MNGYVCFYNGQRKEVHADTLLKARDQAASLFKTPKNKRHLVACALAEKDGEQVTHTPDF